MEGENIRRGNSLCEKIDPLTVKAYVKAMLRLTIKKYHRIS